MNEDGGHAAGGASSLDELFARMSAGGRTGQVASDDGSHERIDADDPDDGRGSLLRGTAQYSHADNKSAWKRGFK